MRRYNDAGVALNGAPAQVASRRREDLDLFRFLAVSFALVSHALIAFGEGDIRGSDLDLARRVVTRTATPSLLFLFGIMARLVYLRRFPDSIYEFRKRIYTRAIFCVLALWTLSFFIFLIDGQNLSRLLRQFTIIQSTRFANIFTLYFFILLLLEPLFRVRSIFGTPGLMGIVALITAYTVFVLPGIPAAPRPFAHLAAFSTGAGSTWGPSIIHSFIPVISGFVFAGGFLSDDKRKDEKIAFLFIFFSMFALFAISLFQIGVRQFALGIADISTFRSKNALEFYAFGLVASVVLFLVARGLAALSIPPLIVASRKFGSATFPYFLIGNIVNLIIWKYKDIFNPFIGNIYIGVVIALLVSMLATWVWLMYGRSAAVWRYFDRCVQNCASFLASALNGWRRRA